MIKGYNCSVPSLPLTLTKKVNTNEKTVSFLLPFPMSRPEQIASTMEFVGQGGVSAHMNCQLTTWVGSGHSLQVRTTFKPKLKRLSLQLAPMSALDGRQQGKRGASTCPNSHM